jgi:hypothetical protein
MNARDIFYQSSVTLFHAVVANNLPSARESLESGAEANWVGVYDRRTPLMLAALRGNLEMISLLHSFGADIHVKSSNQGMDALSFAVANAHPEACRLLLELGAGWTCSTPHIILTRLGYGLEKFEETGFDDWVTTFCPKLFGCFSLLVEWSHRRGCDEHPQVCICRTSSQWCLNTLFVHHSELFVIPLPEHQNNPRYMYTVLCDWSDLFLDPSPNESLTVRLGKWMISALNTVSANGAS